MIRCDSVIAGMVRAERVVDVLTIDGDTITYDAGQGWHSDATRNERTDWTIIARFDASAEGDPTDAERERIRLVALEATCAAESVWTRAQDAEWESVGTALTRLDVALVHLMIDAHDTVTLACVLDGILASLDVATDYAERASAWNPYAECAVERLTRLSDDVYTLLNACIRLSA